MNKKIALSLVFGFLLVQSSLFAQVSAGIKGGINIPNLTSPFGGAGNYSTEVGLDAAVFVNYPITETFAIEPRLEYSGQSAKRDGIQGFPIPGGIDKFIDNPILGNIDSDEIYVDVNSKVKLDFLLLPVMADFGWDFSSGGSFGPGGGSFFRFYVQGGPYIGYLLNANLELTETETKIYTDKKGDESVLPGTVDIGEYMEGEGIDPSSVDVKDEFETINFGLSGNVGLAYYVSEFSSVFLEIGGNYGFMNIQKTGDGKKRPGALTAGIGYTYHF